VNYRYPVAVAKLRSDMERWKTENYANSVKINEDKKKEIEESWK
jgi:hypothetical protein